LRSVRSRAMPVGTAAGAGAIPLSIGYSGINGTTQGEEFGRVFPPVMFGNLVAVA